LEIAGEKETFTATVSYDTRELYGKISGSFAFEVAAE
jgi:hypothetical protein